MIDAHSHICISEEGMGGIGDDCCDYSGALTPEVGGVVGGYPGSGGRWRARGGGRPPPRVRPGSDGGGGGAPPNTPERHGSRRDAPAALHRHEVQRRREPQDCQARL